MKLVIPLLTPLFAVAQAAFSCDIVQYWMGQVGALINSTVLRGLQSPSLAWGPAVIHGAIYLAPTDAADKPLAFQQLAVSHATHISLIWLFHGTKKSASTNAALQRVLGPIGLSANSTNRTAATKLVREAARTGIIARADDYLMAS